jgi:zeaxanthin glucosyltransferase
VNRRPRLYFAIAEACARLVKSGIEAQLVISLGGADPRILGELPGSPIVVRYAPQRKLLTRSFLTITHAGLNTTLESLREGVPLVAIPITFEQPGVAARIRWTRTGDFVRYWSLNSARLRKTLERVVRDPAYRESAERMKAAIAATRGAEHAADIIEKVAATGRPVAAGKLTMTN